MTQSDPKAVLTHSTKSAKSLTTVLGQSEHVKNLVEECADELSSVNEGLKQEVAAGDSTAGVENALEKSEAVENKVQEASDKLRVVNQALEDEVKGREVLEHQLVAAKEQEESARHAAFHDPLTGLPNRVLFNDRLEHGLAQARRHEWILAVMFVDLDEFKAVNDSYGHTVGDAVLQVISQRLKDNTREDDTVCRHGGDEFLYLLMEIKSEEDIIQIAEKIINAIEEPCDVSICNLNIKPSIRASIGISMFPQHGETADILIKCADKAMYRAKRTRSGYAFAR